MKRVLYILSFVLWLTGCARGSPEQLKTGSDGTLGEDFVLAFDRLFLSDEPLRYQDNVAFLEAIRPEELGTAERALLRGKLKQFLSLEDQARDYAPDSLHTGVASEVAFLRLQSVQLLSQVGTQEDIGFIEELAQDTEGEHPLFQDACKQVVEMLQAQ